jgi:hypothetical protein
MRTILGGTVDKDTPRNNPQKKIDRLEKRIEETENATISALMSPRHALGVSEKHSHDSLHAEE